MFRAVQLASIACLIAFLATASLGADLGLLGPMAIRSDEELSILEAASEKAYKEGRYVEAVRLYSEAIRIYPACSGFYFGRGMAYEMIKKPQLAKRDYIAAIRLDPRNYEAMENLGGIMERTGQSTEEAIELYKKALKLDTRPEWKENLAVWIRILESNLRSDASAVACWHRGNSRIREGKLEEAAYFYSRAIELNPIFFQAYYSRALLRLRVGNSRGALSDLNVAIDMSPGLRGALVQRALVYERSGERQRAMNDLRRAVRVDRGDPEAHYQLGRMLQEDGQYAAAAESFQQALHLKPKPELRALIRGRILALRRSLVLRGSDAEKGRRVLRH